MGITVIYYRLPKAEREKVTRDDASWQPFEKRMRDAYFKVFRDAIDVSNKIKGTREEQMAKMEAYYKEHRDPREYDMEKDWQTIGYLLTGNPKIQEKNIEGNPLHNAIYGGIDTKPQSGYGPVRYYDGKMVAECAAALKAVDREQMKKRFDPKKMEELEIYAASDEGDRAGIFAAIEEFTAFFQTAAATHDEVVRYAT